MNKKYKNKFFLLYGDLTDVNSISTIVNKIKPDEIYNLAAQSHVGVSFEMPHYTAQVNAIGTLNILEAIRQINFNLKLDFIKHLLQNYLVKYKIKNNQKKQNFIQRVLMQHLNYLGIG